MAASRWIMTCPRELDTDRPMTWSPGTGRQVWGMLAAAWAGDLAALRALLAADPALARAQHGYRGPLSFAVRGNQLAAAQLLLDAGAEPLTGVLEDPLPTLAQDRGLTGMSALLTGHLVRRFAYDPRAATVAEAIRARDVPRVCALLDREPALVHASDDRTNRPIHWAVMSRQLDLVDELLARTADLEAVRADGARPIQLFRGDYHYRGWRDVPDAATSPAAVMEHLIARGAVQDAATAAWRGDLDRLRELVAADPGAADRPVAYVGYYHCGGTPLRNAAAAGHRAVVEWLLAHGANPNRPEPGIAPRGHALYAAVVGRHREIVELLLAHGADPSAPVESSADCLTRAHMNGDQAMALLLREHGATRSVDVLAYHGDLLAGAAVFGANPALADDPDALASAAGEGQAAFVRLMLRAQPELARRVGCAGAEPAITELLFAHGMDPSHRDWLGYTPLHRFARHGEVDRAVQFLDRGAELEARDSELEARPLAHAARTGQTTMVELLLARGAAPDHPDDPDWSTPLAWARRRGHAAAASALERAGARR